MTPPPPNPAAAREALGVFALSALVTAVVVGIGRVVPLIGQNALALVALVFVYLPVAVLRRRGKDPGNYGLSAPKLRRGLGLGLLLVAITVPGFLVGFHIWESLAFGHGPDVRADNYLQFSERLLARPRSTEAPGLYVWREQRELHLRWSGDGPWRIELATACQLTQRGGPLLQPAGADRQRVTTPRGGYEIALWARGCDDLSIEAWWGGEPLPRSLVWEGGGYGDPDEPSTLVLPRTPWWIFMSLAIQLLLVAFPEEFFYRGYMQARLGEWYSRRWSLGPLHTSTAILITSACFALGHFVVGFSPQRLAVFFPSLAFGWLRDRSGGLGGCIVYHAACNLMVELTVVHYWPS